MKKCIISVAGLVIFGCKSYPREISEPSPTSSTQSATAASRTEATNAAMLNVQELIQSLISVLNQQPKLASSMQEFLESSKSTAGEAASKPPLVVTMGGFLSCGIDSIFLRRPSPLLTNMSGTPMVETALKLDKKFKENTSKNPVHILSCYGMDPSVIYYATNSNGWSSVMATSVAEFFSYVEKIGREHAVSETFLVGHSYGGWTAMALATHWGVEKKAPGPVAAIVTNDPISKVLCTPDVFVNRMGSEGSPCTRSPQDSEVDVNLISKIVQGQWQNYFQTDASALHSSEIHDQSNLIKNIRLDYAQSSQDIAGHIYINFDEQRFIDPASDFILCSAKVNKLAQAFSSRCAKAQGGSSR